MGVYASKDVAFFLVGGYSLLAQIGSFEESGPEGVIKETTPLGSQWPRNADTGNRRSSIVQDGWFDDAAGSTHDALKTPGLSRVLCYGLEGNTKGKHFVGFEGALQSKYTRTVQLEDFHRAKAEYAGNGKVEQGVILHELAQEAGATWNTQGASHDFSTENRMRLTTITSSSVANPTVITCATAHGLTTNDKVVIADHAGSTPSINGEHTATVLTTTTFTIPVSVTAGGAGGTVKQASTQNGGSGYLQVSQLALGGFTNFQAKVRHSVDNAAWVDLVTFTVVTAAPAAERVAVAGTVNRYLASSGAYGGAGAEQTVTAAIGFARPETA
jgi:hypothetical protein